ETGAEAAASNALSRRGRASPAPSGDSVAFSETPSELRPAGATAARTGAAPPVSMRASAAAASIGKSSSRSAAARARRIGRDSSESRGLPGTVERPGRRGAGRPKRSGREVAGVLRADAGLGEAGLDDGVVVPGVGLGQDGLVGGDGLVAAAE